MNNALTNETEFMKEVAIDKDHLGDSLLTHAEKFAHYGHQAARAEFHYDELKIERERVEAVLDEKYRELLSVDGKRPTETMIQGQIKRDPEWLDISHKMTQSKLLVNIQKSNKEAFFQRGMMLVQLSKQDHQPDNE